MERKIVLIAGGSGLIGRDLQKSLEKAGSEVRVLTRQTNPKVPYFHWNYENNEIDRTALQGVQVIVNLSGTSIAGKRWTAKRKEDIINSRVKSTQFLHEISKEIPTLVQFISASGITCYGYDNPTKIYKESDDFGTDFLSQVVKEWEATADLFSPQYKVAKIRTGVVLTEKGGALPQISKVIKKNIGAPLGRGGQMMPWITLRDIVRVYIHVINRELEGTYNASAAGISNAQLTNVVAKKLHKPLWLPKIPRVFIKLVLGEMSVLILKGITIDNSKIVNAGFAFKHKTIEDALTYIYDEKEGTKKE